MMNFFEIPKNAHETCFFLSDFYPIAEQKDVLVLRDPLKRFWSACKTNTAELSPFGNWPTWSQEDFKNKPTNYDGLSLTPKDVIEKIKETMRSGELSLHLQTQKSYIGEKKFDHIIKVESLREDLDALSKLYGFDPIREDLMPTCNVSVKDWDEEALKLIETDDYIKTFYADDIELYNDTSSLLKASE